MIYYFYIFKRKVKIAPSIDIEGVGGVKKNA